MVIIKISVKFAAISMTPTKVKRFTIVFHLCIGVIENCFKSDRNFYYYDAFSGQVKISSLIHSTTAEK